MEKPNGLNRVLQTVRDVFTVGDIAEPDPTRRLMVMGGLALAGTAALSSQTQAACAQWDLMQLFCDDQDPDISGKEQASGKKRGGRQGKYKHGTYRNAARDYYSKLGRKVLAGEFDGPVDEVDVNRYQLSKDKRFLIEFKIRPGEDLETFQTRLVNTVTLMMADYGYEGKASLKERMPPANLVKENIASIIGIIANTVTKAGTPVVTAQGRTRCTMGVNSGFRLKKHNAQLAGAAKNSLHTQFRAIDIYHIDGRDPLTVYAAAATNTMRSESQTVDCSGGTEYYHKRNSDHSFPFTHVDDGKRSRWRPQAPDFDETAVAALEALPNKTNHAVASAPAPTKRKVTHASMSGEMHPASYTPPAKPTAKPAVTALDDTATGLQAAKVKPASTPTQILNTLDIAEPLHAMQGPVRDADAVRRAATGMMDTLDAVSSTFRR